VPTVLTVHDLYALHQGAGPRGTALRWGYGRSLRRAGVLAATNEAVAAEVVDELGVAPGRVATYRPPTPLGAEAPVAPEGAPARFALHVSDLNPRKNASLLFDLWPGVHARTGVPLVLVGARHGASADLDRVRALAAEGVVVDLGAVGDAELAWLYGHADALLFPSVGEGWGYPVEEAVAVGCPVVTAPVPVLEAEAVRGADGVTVLDPHDRAAWSAAAEAACGGRPRPPADRRPVPAGSSAGDLVGLYERAVGAVAAGRQEAAT
jgi:glycosyltransferase involved in cell wall biosynthesis